MARPWLAAAVLAVAVAGCLPGPGGGAVVDETAAPTAATASGCGAGDLEVMGTPWTGAAGSRWTDVTVRNIADRACDMPAAPVVGLRDSEGRLLVESRPDGPGGTVALEPGQGSTFTVRFSNACERSLAMPVELLLALSGGAAVVQGTVMETSDDLAPCNAPDEPSAIEASPWGGG